VIQFAHYQNNDQIIYPNEDNGFGGLTCEQCRIIASLSETHTCEFGLQLVAPLSRCLFEAIDGLLQLSHLVGAVIQNRWLSHENCFALQKCTLDINMSAFRIILRSVQR
jgi:hypothetical protein